MMFGNSVSIYFINIILMKILCGFLVQNSSNNVIWVNINEECDKSHQILFFGNLYIIFDIDEWTMHSNTFVVSQPYIRHEEGS